MSDSGRPTSPHLQVYRWQITMVMSILHRATGCGLSVGAAILVAWLIAASAGAEAYQALADGLATPLGLLILAGLSFCFFYHLGNGIRHLAWDAGWGFEIGQMYASGWTVVVFAAAATGVHIETDQRLSSCLRRGPLCGLALMNAAQPLS